MAANWLGQHSYRRGLLISAFVIMALLDLPFSLYHTFVIEERFGFNKTTLGTFIGDMLKQTLLMLILGVPLAWAALWLMQESGGLWWLYLWLLWAGFSLLMLWAYPAVIAPLFNKFTLLEDEQLQRRIQTCWTAAASRARVFMSWMAHVVPDTAMPISPAWDKTSVLCFSIPY